MEIICIEKGLIRFICYLRAYCYYTFLKIRFLVLWILLRIVLDFIFYLFNSFWASAHKICPSTKYSSSIGINLCALQTLGTCNWILWVRLCCSFQAPTLSWILVWLLYMSGLLPKSGLWNRWRYHEFASVSCGHHFTHYRCDLSAAVYNSGVLVCVWLSFWSWCSSPPWLLKSHRLSSMLMEGGILIKWSLAGL